MLYGFFLKFAKNVMVNFQNQSPMKVDRLQNKIKIKQILSFYILLRHGHVLKQFTQRTYFTLYFVI